MAKGILAIDPSIRTVGWAYEGENMGFGTIKTEGTGFNRLSHIRREILELIDCCNPEYAVVELPPHYTYRRSNKGGTSANMKSIQLLNMAFGVILEPLMKYCASVDTPLPEEYKPRQTRGRMIVCMTAKEVMQSVKLQISNDISCNEHEAHAIYMLLWKKQRLRIESMIQK